MLRTTNRNTLHPRTPYPSQHTRYKNAVQKGTNNVQTACCGYHANNHLPGAFFDLPLPLALTSCSGLPRACMRSVHTRHRHASFRAVTRAHLDSRVPSRTQTHNRARRPMARAGTGAVPVSPGAGAAVVPFCCCGESPLLSRQSGEQRTPPPSKASSGCPLCVTILIVPSPDSAMLGVIFNYYWLPTRGGGSDSHLVWARSTRRRGRMVMHANRMGFLVARSGPRTRGWLCCVRGWLLGG